MLYPDIYRAIAKFCDIKTQYNLARTCKTFWTTYNEDLRLKIGNFNLKRCQVITLKYLYKYGRVRLNAPIGYGKTAIGLACIFKDYKLNEPRKDKLWIILVPPKAVGTWKSEAEKIFNKNTIFRPNTLESPLLILDTKYSKQELRSEEDLSPFTWAIVISTYKYSKYASFLFNNINIVVDEVHTGNRWYRFLEFNFDKCLLLTGTRIDYESMINYSVPNLKNLEIIWASRDEEVPIPIHQYLLTEEIEMGKTRIDEKEIDYKKYIVKIEYLLSNFKNIKVVIFYPNYHFDKMIIQEIKSLAEKYLYTFYVYQKINDIEKFEKEKKSILMLSHTYSESINISAEACISIRIDWMNPDRINQIIGRVLRPSNRNRYVYIYHILPNGFPKYKVMYSTSFYKCDIKLSSKEVNVGQLLESFKILKMFDSTLKQITESDIVAVCNQDYNPMLLDWWLKQKSIIPDDMKKRIYTV